MTMRQEMNAGMTDAVSAYMQKRPWEPTVIVLKDFLLTRRNDEYTEEDCDHLKDLIDAVKWEMDN